MGTLKSDNPESDVKIPENKDLICSALECYKKGIENIIESLKGDLNTEPSLSGTKTKITAIDSMIKEICDGKVSIIKA